MQLFLSFKAKPTVVDGEGEGYERKKLRKRTQRTPNLNRAQEMFKCLFLYAARNMGLLGSDTQSLTEIVRTDEGVSVLGDMEFI